MTLRTILWEWRRRGGPAMVRVNVGIEIVCGVAGKAIALNGSPLSFGVSNVAFGARRESVHARERKARPPMDVERLHVVPSPRGVATVAAAAQPFLVRIAVAVGALSSHAPLAVVALIAGRSLVSAGQRKPGEGVIEALAAFATAHAPAGRRVAIAAVQTLGDRVVSRVRHSTGFVLGIFGRYNPHSASENGEAQADDSRPSHREPFRRAWGLP